MLMEGSAGGESEYDIRDGQHGIGEGLGAL